MYHYLSHQITIEDDDPLFDAIGDYMISLSYKTEVIVAHNGVKTYMCSLAQGQYDMFMQWLGCEGDEEIKSKVMEQIKS